MKRAGIKAQVGYRSPRARKGEASIVSPNRLQQQFNPDAPDERWVTDITYIRTHEGWLYLAVVVDLFSRKVIGWSMQPHMTKEIVLNALIMAVWRRNPQNRYWFTLIVRISVSVFIIMLAVLPDRWITDAVKTSRFPDSHSERPAMCLSLDPSVIGKYSMRGFSSPIRVAQEGPDGLSLYCPVRVIVRGGNGE